MSQNNFGGCRMQTAKSIHIPRTMLSAPINGVANSAEKTLSNKIWSSSTNSVNYIKEDGKSRFSEKLKVLLANGAINDSLDDPYAFREVEQQTLLKPSFNVSDSLYINRSGNNLKVPERQDENRSTSNTEPTTVAVTTDSIDLSSSSPKYNFKPCDILPRHAAEAAKVRSPLLKAKAGNLSSNARSVQNNCIKLFSKTNISPNMRMGSKPNNFGKSQMSKLAIAKIEKTLEMKKNVLKNTLAVCSNQKTPAINKLNTKPKIRSATMRSASLDSDISIKSYSKSKTKHSVCKSLLEESLSSVTLPNNVSAMVEVKYPNEDAATALPAANTASPTVFLPTLANLKHESLERLWILRNKVRLLKTNYQQFGLLVGETESDMRDSEANGCLFQTHWFSLCKDYDSFTGHNRKREAKLAQLKTDLRHKLKQHQWRPKDNYQQSLAHLLINTARRKPNIAAFLIRLHNPQSTPTSRIKTDRLLMAGRCTFTDCVASRALPGTPYCQQHILHHPSQVIFTRCVAEGSTCNMPALGKHDSSSLCSKHIKHQISSSMLELTEKSTFNLKRSRSSLGGNRSGRSRKRKRHGTKDRRDSRDDTKNLAVFTDVVPNRGLSGIAPSNGFTTLGRDTVEEGQDVEVGEEVLAMASAELPLDSVELATLATQATGLELEEHDLTNVLNHLPEDAFNDLFTGVKGFPTAQETEDLERALAAVDKDVKTLETEAQDLLQMLADPNINLMPDVVPVLYQTGLIAPLEQAICEALPMPNPLLISPHTDILQS